MCLLINKKNLIKMEVTTRIYLMKDSHGNKASVTVEQSCDTAQICGLKNKVGDDVHFESDAYHISTFCNENDIELKVIDRTEGFDDLWTDINKKELEDSDIVSASHGIEPIIAKAYNQKSAKRTFIRKNPFLVKLLINKYPEHNTDETWQSIAVNGGSVQHLDFIDSDDKEVFLTFAEINQNFETR
jgi:hypothetical protein